MPTVRHATVSIFLLIVLAIPHSATAQQSEVVVPEEDSVTPSLEDTRWSRLHRPGTIDAQLTLGFGTFLTPQLEPAVDVGLIPIGADNTISLGASAGFGYCLGCLILSALPGLSVRAWSLEPQLRVLAHFGSLSKSLNIPEIDLYAGPIAGFSMYQFTWTQNQGEVNARDSLFGISAGLLGGLHYLLSDRVFAGAELKYALTFGLNSFVVEVGDTTYSDISATNYVQNGFEYNFHLGARF